MSDSVTSAPVCDSRSSFCGWIWTEKAPTSQHLALRNMTNIEHRSLFQLLQNLRARDAEGLGKRRPTCDRVKTAYYRPTTARTRGYRLRDQLHLAARQQEIHCIDLYLLGASLLVTPVSLVASCKKWTCPPDNHARTFDMSGEILTCLGHTDWHYFEPWVKVAQYPVCSIAQSALHFTPWQTCPFRHQLGCSWNHSSHAAITRND